MKHLAQGLLEDGGDLEREFERRRVLGRLDRVDGLARDANAIGKVPLGHLASVEAEAPDLVADAHCPHRGRGIQSAPFR